MPAPSLQTRVLLVDDDELVARGYARLLRHQGHAVSTAGSAEEAIELMAGQSYDVVVSDIMMPGAGGLAMLRAVRSLDADLPVILMTGCPTIESAVGAVHLGALKYLMKPIVDGGLEQAVEDAAVQFRHARRRTEALAFSDQGADSLAELKHSFERAINELWMAYQPIVSWSRQQLFGFEALLRTSEPAFPHPGVLLAAGEKLHLLDTLGRTIRASVASTLSSNPGSTASFVNLHAQDLADESLYSLHSPLSAFAPRVVLEITERESIEHIEDLKARVARLRALGFRIAIDDLGAGYAGLNTIAQLEPDVVKLDMSLVRGVDVERTKRKLIGSMVGACRDLGILVVAEGIETPAEREALIDLGCDLFQGYLLGRPERAFPAAHWAEPPGSVAIN